MKNTDKTTKILGLDVFSRPKSELLNILRQQLLGSSGLVRIMTPNPEQLVQAEHNMQFKADLQAAEILLPDGIGVLWAEAVLLFPERRTIAERVAGADVVFELLKIAAAGEHSVLIVGGKEYAPGFDEAHGVGDLEPQLQRSYPELAGMHCNWTPGYADVTHQNPEENKQLCSLILNTKPEVVLVAFGAPHQERWIQANREVLAQAGVRITMAVGGSLDFILHKVPRAPKAWQKIGLEWLYRLLQEPWRWRRQLRLVQFIGLVAREWLQLRFTRSHTK